MRLGRMRHGALAAAIAVILVSGCSAAPGAGHRHLGASSPVGFWTRSRLIGTRPLRGGQRLVPLPRQSAKSHTAPPVPLRVGALFERDASGQHFCTASVVTSPGKNLLITAAHCINGGKGSGYKKDIVFIPDYRDGEEPYGVWTLHLLQRLPQ
jgi:hypothetical protein